MLVYTYNILSWFLKCLIELLSPEVIKYLFKFPFLRSGDKAKRGVEFRRATCNDSRIRY